MDLLSTAARQTVVGEAASETQHVLSKEDFLKLMLPDSPLAEEGRRKVSELPGGFEMTRCNDVGSEETQKFQEHPPPAFILSRDSTRSSGHR